MDTIVDYLSHWAAVSPDKCFSVFLDRNGAPRETYTTGLSKPGRASSLSTFTMKRQFSVAIGWPWCIRRDWRP